ncbi:MAG: cation diffusion facilitator family transporter [Gammaproteobacteria bacterium]|nr:cation diffusion facilitator family transporter [Gammaproteobacteria bacterium]
MKPFENPDYYSEIRRLTLIGGVLDLFLGFVKVLVGYIGNSQALIADGIHSLSDLITDILVLVATKQSAQAADEGHPYGHDRIQTLVSLALAGSLGIIAIVIAWDAVIRIVSPESLLQPGFWPLAVAAISVVSKEGYFQYVVRHPSAATSRMLYANAWHSRSDALSSLAVIVGVGGVLAGFAWADAFAAIVVAGLLLVVAYRIGREGAEELIDSAASPVLNANMRKTILSIEGVRDSHELRTRRMADKVLADVHIRVDPLISVSEGHRIGDEVMDALKTRFPEVGDVVVHIDPEDDIVGDVYSKLPMRSVIVAEINTNLHKLQNNFDARFSLQPKNIVVHYLDDGCQIEIWMTMPDEATTRDCSLASSTIKDALMRIDNIVSASVLFSSN